MTRSQGNTFFMFIKLILISYQDSTNFLSYTKITFVENVSLIDASWIIYKLIFFLV